MATTMATGSRFLFFFFGIAFVVLLFSMESVVGADSSVRQIKPHQPNKDIDIIATYMDSSGALRTQKVKSSDLSPSWVIEKYDDENHVEIKSGLEYQGSTKSASSGRQVHHQTSTDQQHNNSPIDPVKLKRQRLREKRRQTRIAELLQTNENDDHKTQLEAIQRTKTFGTWTKEVGSETTLDSMRDQIILLKVYSSIARTNKMLRYSDDLNDLVKRSLAFIGLANSDDELKKGALEQAKKMGRELSKAKDKLYDCEVVERKLRAMAQSVDETMMALKKKNLFLMQVASFTIPKPLQCLHVQLTNDYFSYYRSPTKSPDKYRTKDRSLYHYAIFSDNVLSTSVVVNSAIANAKNPKKHVFHIVTNRLNYAAMKMWFTSHPLLATVEVKSMDDFKWLNLSYCPVLRQLESAKLKQFYFKSNNPSHLAVLKDHLSYRNPKYLSMLNHIRFYMPEMFPKLDKILFLDDDVVVQKDLTALWSMNMKGMVNGAVETCKGAFHVYNDYLNFSNSEISKNFDPNACGWAFGMNIFDLKLWRKNNLTGVYHYWQDLNEDRQLWKLGTLPPGLITFYKLTYALDKSWHLLGLGYDPSINTNDIKNAAVIHYNGNYKPWMDITEAKYKTYWSKYVTVDDPYFRLCNIKK